MGNQTAISPLLSAFRRYVRTALEARRVRRELALELGHYTSTGDRRELDAIMNRHTAEETAGMRDILERNAS